MTEENDYNFIKPEVTEPEIVDNSYNCGTLTEDATDNSVEEAKVVSDSSDVEGSDSLAGEITDLIEQTADLGKDSDIPKGTPEKTSPVKETSFPEGHVKRSTTVIVGENHKFPVRSRYRSASTSSCHDLCKFGHKHEQAKKIIKRPSMGTITERQPLIRTSSDFLAKSVLNEDTKKKTYGRRLSLPCTTPPIAEEDPRTDIIKNRSGKDLNHVKSKCIQSEVKPSSAAVPGRSSSRNKSESQAGNKITVQSSNLVEKVGHKVKEMKTRTEVGSHSKQEKVREKEKEKAKEPMNYSMSPKPPLKKSPSIKARLYKNMISISHSKKLIKSEITIVNGPGEPIPDKKSMKKALKATSLNERSTNSPRQSHVRKNKDLKSSQNRIQNDPSSSFSPSEPSSTPSTEQKPSQTKRENLKNLESINTKVVGKMKSDNVSKSNTPKTKSSTDSKMTPKRRGLSLTEENDSAWKVKFKRGTVVALQVANSGPKKLRFKRSKTLGDDQNGKGETARALNTSDATNEPNGTKLEPGKVQLRHQEASGKKDNVDLNNVIEETASKLAKTRKSKVKALVGAFETVMSLRDRKPVVKAGAS